jgi:hypothetical protein
MVMEGLRRKMNRAQELENQIQELDEVTSQHLNKRYELIREQLDIQNKCDHKWGDVFIVMEQPHSEGFPYPSPKPVERRMVKCLKCVTRRYASVVGL